MNHNCAACTKRYYPNQKNHTIYLPAHVILSSFSKYPIAQVHVELPGVPMHVCEQFPLLVAHGVKSKEEHLVIQK